MAWADLNLPLKLFKKERSLLQLDSRIEIIKHQVIVEEHVEKEVAALFKRNLIIDHIEEFLCFLEPLAALIDARGHFCQCHSISQHSLISDESFLAKDALGKISRFLRDQNDIYVLLIGPCSELFEQDFDSCQP